MCGSVSLFHYGVMQIVHAPKWPNHKCALKTIEVVSRFWPMKSQILDLCFDIHCFNNCTLCMELMHKVFFFHSCPSKKLSLYALV
jgi:hypothetical protein